MHNCKAISDDLVEMALGRNLAGDELLLQELQNCAACREELATLRNAVRTTEVAMQAAQPAENFWAAYNQRLRRRLDDGQQAANYARGEVRVRGWIPPKFLTSSVPVPVPLVAVLLVFIIFSIVFIVRSRQTSNAVPILTPTSVITRTIEVPVVQQKVVTRVVYRNINRQPQDAASRQIANAPDSQSIDTTVMAQGLDGFKPANEAKVTIIKGSYRDEK